MVIQNRIRLAEYFDELHFNIGAEIGVYEGYYSDELTHHMQNLTLLAVDNWDHERQPAFEIAKKKLEIHKNVVILHGMSMDVVKIIVDESLDFVFIDANHSYNWVKDDIREWSKKVRKGGIVSGHDYYITEDGNKGVVRAVDEYVKEHGYKLQLTPWDYNNPVKDNRQPCWFFVKT